MTEYKTPTTPETDGIPCNHGAPWTSSLLKTLLDMFDRGDDDLDKMCTVMGRSRSSLLSKLRDEGRLISYPSNYLKLYYTRAPGPLHGFITPENTLEVHAQTNARREAFRAAYGHVDIYAEIGVAAIEQGNERREEYRKSYGAFSKRATSEIFLNQPKDNTMTTKPKNIETKTYIAGVEAKDMSDGEIFSKVAELQEKKRRLMLLEVKSVKLTKMIDETVADIDALVAYVDGR